MFAKSMITYHVPEVLRTCSSKHTLTDRVTELDWGVEFVVVYVIIEIHSFSTEDMTGQLNEYMRELPPLHISGP